MPPTPNPPGPAATKPPRQPLLWAAAAFAAGTTLSPHIWRPATWWFATIAVLLTAAAFWTRQRPRAAQTLSLTAIASLAIVAAQLHPITYTAYNLPDEDTEVVVTAHVIAEGEITTTTQGGSRQTLDVITDVVADDPTPLGLRLNLYQPHPNEPFPQLHYGDRLHFSARLRAPHNYHNPGAFDYVAYLASKGIAATASVRADKVERLPGFTGNRWELTRTRIHRSIIAKIHQLWSPQQAALIDAMVIGDAAFIDPDTRADFQRSGTYHILVVSGMNVGILAFASFWLLRKLHAGDFAASILTMILAILYAILTDVGAPVWRAVLMMAVYLGARLLYRNRSMLNALGAAALALMLLDPQTVLGASFQLTFLCVLAIAAVGVPLLERTSAPYRTGLRHIDSLEYDPALPPRVAQFRLDVRMIFARIRRVFRYNHPISTAAEFAFLRAVGIAFAAYDLVVISAIMQVALALPMAYYFHRATSFGIPANMLVVPLTEILMPAAVAAVSLGYIATWLANIPAKITSAALAAITGTVHGLGGLRLADLRVSTPATWLILATCLSLAAAMILARSRWRWTTLGLAALLASALCIAWSPGHPDTHPGLLEITSIDVGEGDSSLIVTPDGKTLLIDAGGPTGGPHLSTYDIGENVVSPYLWSRGIHRLDAVALTHAHSDHMGGMRSILKNFRPKTLWLSVIPPNEDLAELLTEARSLGIQIEQHFDGDQFQFGNTTISVLAPAAEWQSFRPGNNDSLVLKITYGATSALMEGDAESLSEARMVAAHPSDNVLNSTVLKVAHHGSKTSSNQGFLAAVRPRYAIISVGTHNPFGLPKLEVLNRLQTEAIPTYRTDLNGATTFLLNGKM